MLVAKITVAKITAAAAFAILALSANAQDAKLTDPQIAHIAYTAGTIDIDNAKLALTKSKTAAVRDFANDMVRDHTAVNDKALALVKKLNVTPEDNATSQGLVQKAGSDRAALAQLDGSAFDKAYVANEVAYHKTVNNALQTALIPGASNPDLKALLNTGLKIFKGHEQHAEHLAASLK